MKKLIILLFLIFSANIAHSFIYHFDVLTHGTHNYFILGDDHICETKRQEVGNEQRYVLIKWAKILNASLVVEDMNSANEEFIKTMPLEVQMELQKLLLKSDYHYLSLSKKNNPLSYLSRICRDINITVANPEFRTDDILPFRLIFQKIDQEIKKIMAYNDIFSTIYLAGLENYQKFIENHKEEYNFSTKSYIAFMYFKNILSENALEKLIACYQETLRFDPNANRQLYYESALKDLEYLKENRQFLYKIYSFYWDLRNHLCVFLDYKVLHHMLKQKSTNVIVAVGGNHAKRIIRILVDSDFKSIYSSGDQQFQSQEGAWRAESRLALLPINLDAAFSQVAKWKLQIEEPLLVTNPTALVFKLKSSIDNSYLHDSSWLGVAHNSTFQYTALGALAIAAGTVGYSLYS